MTNAERITELAKQIEKLLEIERKSRAEIVERERHEHRIRAGRDAQKRLNYLHEIKCRGLVDSHEHHSAMVRHAEAVVDRADESRAAIKSR